MGADPDASGNQRIIRLEVRRTSLRGCERALTWNSGSQVSIEHRFVRSNTACNGCADPPRSVRAGLRGSQAQPSPRAQFQVPRARARSVRRLCTDVFAKIDLRWSWTVCCDRNISRASSWVSTPRIR
jgi:hypothetical protein